MKLSKHFSLSVGIKSQTAERLGLVNSPDEATIRRMQLVAINILEAVRQHFDRPVIVSSFYRSPELCEAIGSKRTSQHATGEAVDFEVPGVDNAEVAAWVRDNLEFDQCILEFYTPGIPDSGWVHVSYSGDRCRKECLTINKLGTFPGLAA